MKYCYISAVLIYSSVFKSKWILCMQIMSESEYKSESEDEHSTQRARKASKAEALYDSEDELVNKRTTKAVKKPATSKRKSAVSAEKDCNDSDYEQVNKRATKSVKKPATSKRRSKRSLEDELFGSEDEATKAVKRRVTSTNGKSSASAENRARPSGWELDFNDEEELEASRARAPPNSLQSVLTRRVADGNLRRKTNLPGYLFIELRLYNTNDIKSVAPTDQWEKSVLSLKYRTDSEADELDLLRRFIKKARAELVEEGTFFADKKK